LLLLASAAGQVHAKPKAATVFEDGMAAYRRGEYSEAAEKFYKAYKLLPHADSLYNAALAWELAGEKATAATAYEMVEDDELHAEALADARSKLDKLSKELGRIEVEAPEGATIRVAPFVIEKSKAVFYFDPGKQKIKVTLANGNRVSRSVNAVAGETTVVLVTEAGGDEDEDEDPAEDSTDSPENGGPTKEKKDSSGLTTLGWVSIGVAGVATGAAIFFGLKTLSARDDYNASGHRDIDARDKAKSYMTLTNVAWGTAAITAGAGLGILLLVPTDKDKNTAGVVLHGSF
jgi:tetratricopeptide (TPR) repeat protein